MLLSAIRDRQVAAPLKLVQRKPVAHDGIPIRDRQVAAPLKRRRLVVSVVVVGAIRDRQVAAPLKHQGAPGGRDYLRRLSATVRSRPH